VICVSLSDATSYCEWVANLHGDLFDVRLPAPFEWDLAATGLHGSIRHRKSWLVNAGSIHHRSSHPAVIDHNGRRANIYGFSDIFGNVWEWCLDGGSGDEKLLKGGAFNSPNYDRTSLPDTQTSSFGFRCVVTAQ